MSDTAIKMFKSNDEKQIVYGVVFEPDFVFEADNDFKEEQTVSKEHIEEAAHNYMIKLRREGGLSHQKLSHGQAIDFATDIVESSIVHVDFKIGDELIKEGSWIIGMKIYDKGLWKETKKTLTGFSAGGTAEIL